MLSLPILQARDKITDDLGRPSLKFLNFFNVQFGGAIKRNDAQQAESIERLNLFQSNLERQSVAISHIDGMTATSEADGATAIITITNHNRVYLDKTVTVTGDVIEGLDYGATYSVFYDDPERAGGPVAYQTSLDPTVAVTSSVNPFRHLVAVVTTPATAGDPPTTGGGSVPPGFPSGGYDYQAP